MLFNTLHGQCHLGAIDPQRRIHPTRTLVATGSVERVYAWSEGELKLKFYSLILTVAKGW